MKEKLDTPEAEGTEFPNKMDFCIGANIPVPPYDMEFFNYHQIFPIGPVPMSLGKTYMLRTK